MKHHLLGKKVAILAADGFEQSKLEKPRAAFEEAGTQTHLISPQANPIRGWKENAGFTLAKAP